MNRTFTEDVGRFKRGDIRDYAPPTWKGIARSVRKPLGSFSRPIEDVVKESTSHSSKKKMKRRK